jgi:YHS domain
MVRIAFAAFLLTVAGSAAAAEPPKSAREALKPFNLLVGSWKGTGMPEGSAEDRQKGHWTETVTWGWQFKGDDAWLTVSFDKGKHFAAGELRYRPGGDTFELALTTVGKENVIYSGQLKGKQLVLERPLAGKQVERLTVNLLHDNRVTYRVEARKEGGTALTKKYLVGLTKEGEPFADVGRGGRECIVSGGLGTIAVSHGGKTYYVCCSGCRDEFRADPDKYVKEWEAQRKK